MRAVMNQAQTTRNRWLLAVALTAALSVCSTAAIATPVVTLTSPVNNLKTTPPATVTLTATATESDATATITKVEFFQGGTTLIGTVTTAPYTFSWTNVASGAYAITAKATNSKAVAKTSAARNIVVNTAPTVSLTSPMAGASFYGLAIVNLAVNAADADGNIAKVQYFNGGTLIGTVTSAPFTYAWTGVAPGSYSLTAKATDNLGALVTSAAVAITVKNPVEVAITGPATNSKFTSPGNIAFTVDAITRTCDTCSAPVAKVDFYQGTATTTLIGTTTTAPFTFNWTNVVAGKYTIKAIATDSQGLSTTAKTIAVTVNTPPTIAISSPTTGTSATGLATFNIAADVTDPDNNVTKVQFYRSGTLLGTVTSAPYIFNWQNIVPGNYSLTARATDSLGAVVTSTAIPVTVTNPVNVAIVTPVTKDRYLPGAPISLTASASDANSAATISQVAYYNGTSSTAPLIGISTAAPYEVIWNNVAVGNYTIVAVATDSQGIAKTSTSVKITVDATPDVTLTAPTTNSTFALGSTVTLSATAQNPSGATIAKVQFYAKGKLISTVTTAPIGMPYSTPWTPTVKGSYAITAKATDSLGVSTTSSPAMVGIVVGSAPAVAITSPASSALYLNAPATIDLTAAASTLTGSMSRVEFFTTVNNINTSIGLGTLTAGGTTGGTYKFTWTNVVPGTYNITAIATNSVNLTTTADPVSLTVDAAPVLNLTRPAANALYQLGDTIPLAATATDSDGSIAKVDFYQGTTLLATVTGGSNNGNSNNGNNNTYSFNWSGAAAGSYSLSAIATDNLGATTTTQSINVTVNAAPAASWSAPTDGQVFPAGGSATLTVNATDSDGTIAKVEFYSGTTLIGTVNNGQSGNSGNNYTYNWTGLQGGTYVLSAVATDNNGATVNAGSIGVIVNSPPAISLTSPANNSTANAGTNTGASIAITATAIDSDGTITQVDFYNGINLIGSISTGQAGNSGSGGNTYTFNWANVASGSYTLTAVATDNLGASTTSQAVTISVNALPTVSLTSPANNSTLNAGTAISFNATAADSDGTIAKVEFYNGTTLIGTVLAGSAGDTGTGYTFTWANVQAGTYPLTAKATDNAGGTTSTSAVTITVGAVAAQIYYIHPDHLGTPRAITTSDTANTKVWEWSNSDAFGANLPNEDPANTGTTFKYNLRFPGQYFDQETGTHYNYFRDYDPATGRYIESDPIGLKGGISTYTYVSSNPILRNDRFGLTEADIQGIWRDVQATFPDISPQRERVCFRAMPKDVYGQTSNLTGEVCVDPQWPQKQCLSQSEWEDLFFTLFHEGMHSTDSPLQRMFGSESDHMAIQIREDQERYRYRAVPSPIWKKPRDIPVDKDRLYKAYKARTPACCGK